MSSNNITIIIVAIIVFGFGYFGTMNMWQGNMMMDNEHHEDDKVEAYEIYPGDVAKKIENNEDIVLLDVRTIEEYEEKKKKITSSYFFQLLLLILIF